MHAGILHYDMSYQSSASAKRLDGWQIVKNLAKNLCLPITVNLVILAVLYLSGNGWLYLLWWIAYLTLYMFISRVRNAAEHGSVPDLLDKNPKLHARTTYAAWWERLIFAPNYVNYHLEHHLRPSIPCYHLKAFHRYLLRQGELEDVRIAKNYADVLTQLSVKSKLSST
jgi:fatty acid desaturase